MGSCVLKVSVSEQKPVTLVCTWACCCNNLLVTAARQQVELGSNQAEQKLYCVLL